MENKKFTKDDLKVGYVAEAANQSMFMVMSNDKNHLCLVNDEGYFIPLDSLDDEMHDPNPIGPYDYSVLAVYGYAHRFSYSRDISTRNRSLLWKREEVKKMTVEEIEKELGYKIDIVS